MLSTCLDKGEDYKGRETFPGMSHSQTDSAGEDMVMEQKGSPKEPGEVEEIDEVETQNQRQTDGTQNSNSDEGDGTQSSNSDEGDGTQSSNSDESKSKCSLFLSLAAVILAPDLQMSFQISYVSDYSNLQILHL